MASTLDLYIDTSSGQLVDGGSVAGGSLPTLTRNDSYILRLRLLEKSSSGALDDIDTAGASLKVGIGTIEEAPSSGSFKLAINGVTSSAIPFNATAISLYNAVSNNVSTVALYGSELFGSYLLTASQPNTAMSFTSDAFTLFPTSSVLVGTRRLPSSSVEAQQIVRLVRNPIVYSDSFTDSPTNDEIVLTNIQEGGTSANETYELSVGPRVRGGLFSLSWGGNSTTGIAPFTSAISVQTAISQGINTITSNISVQDNGKGGYIFQFTGRLGQINVTTPLLLDSSGVNFIPMKQTTLTINTSEVEDAFASAGTDTITPTIEIELTQGGSPKTIFQGSTTIRKDLITAGSFVPGYTSSYYTAGESDARYVSRISDVGFYSATPISKPTNTTVVSALVNLGLVASSVTLGELLPSYTSISLSGSVITISDGVPLIFGSTTGTQIGTATTQKLAFYNSTPITQPANTNIVSAMVNLGLVASSVTIGNVLVNSTTNIDSTNRKLYDGSSLAINYGGRALNASGLTVLSWADPYELKLGYAAINTTIILEEGCAVSVGTSEGSKIGTTSTQKIGFWGSTPVTQPNQPNVVTALRECGLLASSPGVSTFGVFPLSPRTLTTTASLAFGTILNNASNSISVSVTGAALNDIVLIGLPSAISSGLSFIGHVATAGIVDVDAVNATNGSISQSTQTYRVTVIGY